jgi:hypothetical protein
MKYAIIFWGYSPDSKKIFTLQKKIVRITVGAKPQTPYRVLFKKLQTLPLPYEYIYSLLNFVINNLEHFQTNSAIHCVNTRNKHHLHRPVANLIRFQKVSVIHKLSTSIWNKEELPDQWKESIIVPIHQKGIKLTVILIAGYH